MRITFPLLSLGPSGGSRVIADLANGLKEKGHEVFIVVPKGADKKYYPLNVTVIETGTSLERKGLYYFRGIIVFWEMINLIPRSDIICATAGVTSVIVILAARIFGKGNPVYFIQNSDDLFLEGKADIVLRWLIRRSYRWFDNLIFVSRKLMNFIGFRAKRSIVIHPAISEVFKAAIAKKNKKGKPPLILWVGRKYKIKGLRDMLKAFKVVLKTKKNAKLMLATPDILNVRKSKHISVKSMRPKELAKAYKQADVFVSTSLFEGFCLPPLEAMASGTPVVTTDSVGVMEYANDGVNSLVVPRSDAERIAEAVLRLLNDHALAGKLVRGGIKTAGEFTWSRTVGEFEKFFKKVVRANRMGADGK